MSNFDIIIDSPDPFDDDLSIYCASQGDWYAFAGATNPLRNGHFIKRVEDINSNDGNFEISGFDESTAGEWIYPSNYPVRDYQKNIVTNALLKNTLVSLPTGLGKTFIAAVVMYNFHRWYPHHKVVFMAHSKPLVAQQVQACCQIMGLNPSVTAELNGNISLKDRKNQWSRKQIFFLTPQVFNNDLGRGLVGPESIRCVVIDEAHKALGNQAFCQVIKALQPFNQNFRVLALSATPGDDIPMFKAVVENLLIAHLELRSEEDPDIKKYLHGKKTEVVVVNLDNKIIHFRDELYKVAEKYLRVLQQNKAINSSFGAINSFSLVMRQKQFIANPTTGSGLRGFIISTFSVAISLFKAMEELVVHGLRSFHIKLLNCKSGDGASNNVHNRLTKDEDFIALVDAVGEYIGKDTDVAFDPNMSMARMQDELDAQAEGDKTNIVYSHPKFLALEQIVVKHFEEWKDKKESTKVIVFCKARPCTGEICNFLNKFRPLVKPMILIGQSSGTTGGCTTRGLKQSDQLEVMRKFRSGVYNTLVATCVGEEGLDVGDVDLIVNFDSSKNSNTQVQRSGRTGRKREGRVVNLVTEGKEFQDYNISISKAKAMSRKLSKGATTVQLYKNNPRLLPRNANPVCLEMFLKPQEPKVDQISPRNIAKKKTVTKDSKQLKKSAKKTNKLAQVVNKESPSAVKKYDIRYAMSQVKEKAKSVTSHDDSSGSLFESLRPVEMFKEMAKETKKNANLISDFGGEQLDRIEDMDSDDVICLDMPSDRNTDNLPLSQKANSLCLPSGKNLLNTVETAYNQLNSIFNARRLSLPLDLDACDKLDELSMDELVALAASELENVNFTDNYKSYKYTWKPMKCDECPMSPLHLNEPLDIDVPVEISSSPQNLHFEDGLINFQSVLRETASDGNCSKNTPHHFTTKDVGKTIDDLKNDCMNVACGNDGFLLPTKYGSKSPQPSHVNKLSVSSSLTCDEKQREEPKQSDVSMLTVIQALSFIGKCNVSAQGESKRVGAVLNSSNALTGTKVSTGNNVSPCKGRELNCLQDVTNIHLQQQSDAKQSCQLSDSVDQPETTSFNLKNKSSGHPNTPSDYRKVKSLNTPDPPSPVFLVSQVRRTSKVKKSLLFEDSSKLLPEKSQTASSFESGEVDMFAEDEEELKVSNTQRFSSSQLALPLDNEDEIAFAEKNLKYLREEKNCPQTKETWTPTIEKSYDEEKNIKKLAIVRPLGFEDDDFCMEDGWISTRQKPKSPTFFSILTKSTTKKKLSGGNQRIDSFMQRSVARSAKRSQRTQEPGTSAQVSDTWSTFDCFPEDLSDLFEDAFDGNKQSTPVHSVRRIHQSPSQHRKVAKKKQLTSVCPPFELSDGDLSDGALEAIRAVEQFEMSQKVPNKNDSRSENNLDASTASSARDKSHFSEPAVFDVWDSDNSDDIFEKKLPKKHSSQLKLNVQPTQNKEERRKPPKKYRTKTKSVNPFLEVEAELSGDDCASSDDSDNSNLDELDSSFLDERLAPTQAPGIDMTAKYLATVKSPLINHRGFKIPNPVSPAYAVFSQSVEPQGDYEYDSFCVDDVDETKENELSALELAELILENKKKRRRNKISDDLPPSGRKKKRRRIMTVDSSSDDDEVQEMQKSPQRNIITPVVPMENKTFPEPSTSAGTSGFSSMQISLAKSLSGTPLVFIGSRQIASAPEITTALRAKWKCRVEVRSTPGADFIVSWRMGIIRITLSDFSSCSPATKLAIKESMEKLVELFQKPIVIVEDDKNKGTPRTVGCHREMWMKHSAKRLARLHHANIQTIFTRSKSDTAQVVANLTRDEVEKGHAMEVSGKEIAPELEPMLKFYTSLPGINIANAIRIHRKFKSIGTFLRRCKTASTIQEETGVQEEMAVRIFRALFISF